MERRFKVMSRCPSCCVQEEYDLAIDDSELPFNDGTYLKYKCPFCGHEYIRKALERHVRWRNR